jgi:hypothetical protein
MFNSKIIADDTGEDPIDLDALVNQAADRQAVLKELVELMTRPGVQCKPETAKTLNKIKDKHPIADAVGPMQIHPSEVVLMRKDPSGGRNARETNRVLIANYSWVAIDDLLGLEKVNDFRDWHRLLGFLVVGDKIVIVKPSPDRFADVQECGCCHSRSHQEDKCHLKKTTSEIQRDGNRQKIRTYCTPWDHMDKQRAYAHHNHFAVYKTIRNCFKCAHAYEDYATYNPSELSKLIVSNFMGKKPLERVFKPLPQLSRDDKRILVYEGSFKTAATLIERQKEGKIGRIKQLTDEEFNQYCHQQWKYKWKSDEIPQAKTLQRNYPYDSEYKKGPERQVNPSETLPTMPDFVPFQLYQEQEVAVEVREQWLNHIQAKLKAGLLTSKDIEMYEAMPLHITDLWKPRDEQSLFSSGNYEVLVNILEAYDSKVRKNIDPHQPAAALPFLLNEKRQAVYRNFMATPVDNIQDPDKKEEVKQTKKAFRREMIIPSAVASIKEVKIKWQQQRDLKEREKWRKKTNASDLAAVLAYIGIKNLEIEHQRYLPIDIPLQTVNQVNNIDPKDYPDTLQKLNLVYIRLAKHVAMANFHSMKEEKEQEWIRNLLEILRTQITAEKKVIDTTEFRFAHERATLNNHIHLWTAVLKLQDQINLVLDRWQLPKDDTIAKMFANKMTRLFINSMPDKIHTVLQEIYDENSLTEDQFFSRMKQVCQDNRWAVAIITEAQKFPPHTDRKINLFKRVNELSDGLDLQKLQTLYPNYQPQIQDFEHILKDKAQASPSKQSSQAKDPSDGPKRPPSRSLSRISASSGASYSDTSARIKKSKSSKGHAFSRLRDEMCDTSSNDSLSE